MSRYRNNDEKCGWCELTYRNFRTGLDYKTVREWFWSPSPDYQDWKYKRRNTVLGAWHAEKKRMWNEHLAICYEAARKEERRLCQGE